MLTNSSSNIFPSLPLFCSFNTSLYPATFSCFDNIKHIVHFYLYTLTCLLLILPLYLFILWMGFQKWRYNRPASGQASHTDVFTYCMAAVETLSFLGYFSFCCGISICSTTVMVFGYYCLCIDSTSQTAFHCLTCIERYLAVVHPIIYMKLKKSQGVRIRNICIVFAWLLSLGGFASVLLFFPVFPTSVYSSMFVIIFMIVTFCSLAVFSVLICSKMKTDQTKWRAFYTIVAITATLALRFSGQTASIIIFNSKQGTEFICETFLIGFWLCLPSSLVLPLLFLHRNGKLTCHKCNLN